MKAERGSAILVVLTLLSLVTIAILINGRTLDSLRIELGRIDRQQQSHFKAP